MKTLLTLASSCLAAALLGPGDVARADRPPARELDLRRLEAAGIRLVEGPRLRLLTDLPTSPAVDGLPEVFAAAVPQWAAYFGTPPEQLDGWQMQGFLIRDRGPFAALDLLPRDNPDFVNGYSNGYELWLMEQPSDYYRRHLLLHEGTHGYMLTQLGACGPGWFMEGTAELLGAHRWSAGSLQLGVVPASREAAPMWGRVKLIRRAFAEGRALPIAGVMKIDNRRRLNPEHYAWTWALAALLEGDPRFRERFRELQQHVQAVDFDEQFRRLFANDWDALERQWQATVANLDYGYDFKRMSNVERPGEPLSKPAEIDVAVDRGWQSTGWLLEAGRSYRITASGRYRIAVDAASDGGRAWPCEPGGVTLTYHQGQPLGLLLGALVAPRDALPQADAAEVGEATPRPQATDDAAGLAGPVAIGVGRVLRPRRDAVLYLRVNDSPARLAENEGRLQVRVAVGL